MVLVKQSGAGGSRRPNQVARSPEHAIERIRTPTRCDVESHGVGTSPRDVGPTNAWNRLEQPLHAGVVGQGSDTLHFDQDLGLRLRKRRSLRRRQQIHRTVNAGGQRTAPALAGEARVQRPLILPCGRARVRAADQNWKRLLNRLIQENQPAINKILLDYGIPLLDENDQPIGVETATKSP